ncbi:hypothetical protein RI367_007376 [Sorochytrium milnesiophthora]
MYAIRRLFAQSKGSHLPVSMHDDESTVSSSSALSVYNNLRRSSTTEYRLSSSQIAYVLRFPIPEISMTVPNRLAPYIKQSAYATIQLDLQLRYAQFRAQIMTFTAVSVLAAAGVLTALIALCIPSVRHQHKVILSTVVFAATIIAAGATVSRRAARKRIFHSFKEYLADVNMTKADTPLLFEANCVAAADIEVVIVVTVPMDTPVYKPVAVHSNGFPLHETATVQRSHAVSLREKDVPGETLQRTNSGSSSSSDGSTANLVSPTNIASGASSRRPSRQLPKDLLADNPVSTMVRGRRPSAAPLLVGAAAAAASRPQALAAPVRRSSDPAPPSMSMSSNPHLGFDTLTKPLVLPASILKSQEKFIPSPAPRRERYVPPALPDITTPSTSTFSSSSKSNTVGRSTLSSRRPSVPASLTEPVLESTSIFESAPTDATVYATTSRLPQKQQQPETRLANVIRSVNSPAASTTLSAPLVQSPAALSSDLQRIPYVTQPRSLATPTSSSLALPPTPSPSSYSALSNASTYTPFYQSPSSLSVSPSSGNALHAGLDSPAVSPSLQARLDKLRDSRIAPATVEQDNRVSLAASDLSAEAVVGLNL